MIEPYPREYDDCLPEMCLDCNVDPCNGPCDDYKKKFGDRFNGKNWGKKK